MSRVVGMIARPEGPEVATGVAVNCGLKPPFSKGALQVAKPANVDAAKQHYGGIVSIPRLRCAMPALLGKKADCEERP